MHIEVGKPYCYNVRQDMKFKKKLMKSEHGGGSYVEMKRPML